MTGTSLANIGTIIEALPAPIELNSSLVASELSRYSGQASKATEIAERARIDDQDTFDRGADVVRGINTTLKALEGDRKKKTEPYDDAKATLMSLYGSPKAMLEAAKKKLSDKMSRWSNAEERRRAEEAAAAAKAQREEAAALARAQAAMNDEEGAAQIMSEAEELVPVPEKVVAQGNYGATGGTVKRAVGRITDLYAFLGWSLQSAPEIVAGISVDQRSLNRLAKSALESENSPDIPGFKFEYEKSLTIR